MSIYIGSYNALIDIQNSQIIVKKEYGINVYETRNYVNYMMYYTYL